MTATLDKLPKEVKTLPEEAQPIWLAAYNEDFGWRCSEAHAAKAAWRVIYQGFAEHDDGTWSKR